MFNLILLGYALPAVLAAALALIVRGHRPQGYSTTAAVVAVALAIAYLTLEVRTLYHGPVLTAGPTTDAEQYTYSAVWLAFGVALLAAGLFLRSQPVRFASAAVVMLTVFKVFLVDMATSPASGSPCPSSAWASCCSGSARSISASCSRAVRRRRPSPRRRAEARTGNYCSNRSL